MKRRKKLDLSWNNNLVRWITAAVLAVVAWMVVTMNYDKNTTAVMTAEVDFSYRSSGYTNLGVDIVNQPEKRVRVRFEGSGTLLGEMRTSDFVVYPDYSAIRGAGETTLNLLVEITNNKYSSVKATILDASSTVNVVFDTVSEETYPITVETENLRAAEGYLLNRTVANPVEATISGPASEIENIARVVAKVTAPDEDLHESITLPAMLEAQDAEGNPVTLRYAVMNISTAEVMMVIHQVRELPLSVSFINIPPGLNIEKLHYHLDRETMMITGPEKTVSQLTELSVASFDLSSFVLGKSYPLAVQLPTGLTSQDGVTAVTLTFDTEDWVQKTVDVSNIRIINPIAGLEVEPVSEELAGVTLVGPREALEALSDKQVQAQITGSDITVTGGQQTVPVRIVIPSSDTIFAVGNYSIACQVNGHDSD